MPIKTSPGQLTPFRRGVPGDSLIFSRKGAKTQRNLTALCLPTAIMVVKVLGTLYLVLRTFLISNVQR